MKTRLVKLARHASPRSKKHRKSRAIINTALAMVKESDKRMSDCSPAQRRKLEAQARRIAGLCDNQ